MQKMTQKLFYMFGNSFIDEIFYWKINTKLYNTSEVDSTSKLTSFIKLLHFWDFQYFLSSKSTSRTYPQTYQNYTQNEKKLNTHISTLIKMFAKLIRPKSDTCWPSGKVFSQNKICFAQSWLHWKIAKIRLSWIESSAFKNSSYAGPSVFPYWGSLPN